MQWKLRLRVEGLSVLGHIGVHIGGTHGGSMMLQ